MVVCGPLLPSIFRQPPAFIKRKDITMVSVFSISASPAQVAALMGDTGKNWYPADDNGRAVLRVSNCLVVRGMRVCDIGSTLLGYDCDEGQVTVPTHKVPSDWTVIATNVDLF
jgi:hypothetical protein